MRFGRRKGRGRGRRQSVGGRLEKHLDQHGGQGVGGVGVVDVAVRVVGAHQGGVEEVAVQDLAEGVGDAFAVPEPGRDERVVEVAVGGVVLGAAQFEGAVGGGRQAGGVDGGDLLERPDGVEVAEVTVVVGVRQARPRPFGQGPVLVDPVRWEPVGEGAPAVGGPGCPGGSRPRCAGRGGPPRGPWQR
ncbi:hypothetical protein BSAF29S_00324 [Bacillus safensis subsp. safensis]